MDEGEMELSSILSQSSGIPQDHGPFKSHASLEEREHKVWGRGPLRTFDVVALIVNKMVGTGIYTSPATVFFMTGNKSLTLGLFGVGFLYSLVSMVIYLGYAKTWPYNGGELIYLDEITSHISYPDSYPETRATTEPVPRLSSTLQLPTTESDGILLEHRATGGSKTTDTKPTSFNRPAARVVRWMRNMLGDGINAMQFGRMILLCIAADNDNASPDVNNDLMRFIGVTILSIICLIQYFSPEFGRSLNKFLAVVKVGFLVGLFFVGVAASSNSQDFDWAADWTVSHHKKSKVSFAKGLLAVLFSFEGWENATFVTGKIPQEKHHILRRGFIIAVCTVGSLYLLIVAVSLHSISWDNLTGREDHSNDTSLNSINFNYPPMLSGNGVTARQAWSVMGAISSFVKQAIGQAEILPWSGYIKQDDMLQRSSEDYNPEKNNSASLESTLESASLPGYIQTYLHCFVLMVLGLGYPSLKSRQDALDPKVVDSPPNRPGGGIIRVGLVLLVGIYALVNLDILITNPIPPYTGSDGNDVAFPGYGFPVILAGLLFVGTAYYLLFFGAAPRHYPVPSSREDDSENEELQPFGGASILQPESKWRPDEMGWCSMRDQKRLLPQQGA
ncbi:Fc.00g096840.m01.CDS01 [Cosmosporella sp. VM-42]